jgi:hypothetical protein
MTVKIFMLNIKKMKQGIILLILILSSFFSMAKLKLGITAGAQISAVKLVDFTTDSRLSFNAGAAGIAPLAEGIDVHLQLLVSGKGYTFYDAYGYKDVIRPLYLELPLNFRFNFNSSNDSKIFIGAGGYYAFGIAGNKIYYPNGYKETEKINFGNTSDDDFNSSDFGLSFQIGAAFRENYEGHFFYDMGLSKIIPNSTSNSYNRVFGFNLTWYFE